MGLRLLSSAPAFASAAYSPHEIASTIMATMDPRQGTGFQTMTANFTFHGARAVAPKSGVITDLWTNISAGATGGNIRGVIYDTGQTTAVTLTELWEGVDVAGAAGWLSLGTGLSVPVVQGEAYSFAIQCDNTTISPLRSTVIAAANVPTLPSTGLDVNGLKRRMTWAITTPPGAMGMPDTLIDTDIGGATVSRIILAKVA